MHAPKRSSVTPNIGYSLESNLLLIFLLGGEYGESVGVVGGEGHGSSTTNYPAFAIPE